MYELKKVFPHRRLAQFLSLLYILTLPLSITVSSVDNSTDNNQIAVYYHDNSEKLIALTFDDGPHYKYTEEILDILDEYNAKATFFVVGELAERYPELILRELAEGHEIGNHTWSHPKMKKLSSNQLTNELMRTEELLNEIADYRPKLFRPPEGSFGKSVENIAEQNDYTLILWTVDTRDWAHTPVDDIVKNVIDSTESGSIILCHDFIGRDSPTPDAIRKFIPALIDAGYKFVTVSELLSK
ncbi:MAG: polysaccharide deacetylase family protein [Clostridiales bacterium]|nr:polysaccharide deacetylase family protein [Clostridiales bacterium]